MDVPGKAGEFYQQAVFSRQSSVVSQKAKLPLQTARWKFGFSGVGETFANQEAHDEAGTREALTTED
jgi:hypothetical protein